LKKLGQIQDKGTYLSTTAAFVVVEIGGRPRQGSTTSPTFMRDWHRRDENQRRTWTSSQRGFNQEEIEEDEMLLEWRLCLGSAIQGEDVSSSLSFSQSHTEKKDLSLSQSQK